MRSFAFSQEIAACTAALLFATASPCAFAQETTTPAPAPVEQDLTGSNPLLYLPTLTLKNEYQNVRGGRRQNITNVNYAQPLNNNKANLVLKVPYVNNNLGAGYKSGLGDIALRYNFLPYVKLNGAIPDYGFFAGPEIVFDTASSDQLGRGKHILQLQAGYAKFLAGGLILAPAVQYNVSFAGENDRRSVSELLFDLYTVKQLPGKLKPVITLDPQFGFNLMDDNHFIGLVEAQLQISPFKPGQNVYVRPGVGFGKYRPYDWNLEFGFSIVGFGM